MASTREGQCAALDGCVEKRLSVVPLMITHVRDVIAVSFRLLFIHWIFL